MAKQSEQITLDELRDKSVKSNTKLSFGKEMGGFNKKQVTEYIDNLTENLRSAEESFYNRLEEYAAMITMLKQERDQYGEMYNLCKNSKIEMLNQIDDLKKENEEFKQVIGDLSAHQNLTQSESFNTETIATSVESQKKLEEYLSYELESKEMKAQLDQLKSMVRDLNNELENYVKENMTEYHPESAVDEKKIDENHVLKSQYEDILRERSALLKEKNRLTEANSVLADEVSLLNEQLKTANEKCDEKIQTLRLSYDSNAEEFIKIHQKTLLQLTENIKNSLNLVKLDDAELSNYKKILLNNNQQDPKNEI